MATCMVAMERGHDSSLIGNNRALYLEKYLKLPEVVLKEA